MTVLEIISPFISCFYDMPVHPFISRLCDICLWSSTHSFHVFMTCLWIIHIFISCFCDMLVDHSPIYYIRGLSGKFVDTACFHWFLYDFQTSFTYNNSVTQEWIKYKTETVLCGIYLQYLLLWQRRVEVTRARQNFLNLIYQILFHSFNVIISKREIV